MRGCFKGVKKCNISVTKDASWVLVGCFMGVERVFLVVRGVYYGYLRSVSCVFNVCLINVLRVFLGYISVFFRVFQGCFDVCF